MSEKEIRALVMKVIAGPLQITDVNTIPNDSSLTDDLGADSLDLVEMAMDIETKLGIEIPDDSFYTVKTVDDAINTIINLMQEK